ncbi:MAG: signal peptidase I [Elusimicrobiota bacterium]|jgi:signal peptidase I|nr:signal peptidase I [Elusimicrobiota bacterium]
MVIGYFNMEQKVVILAIALFVLKFLSLLFLKKYSGNKVLLETLDWVRTAITALWIAFLIMYFTVQAFKIPSGSMEDTLQVGDHLLVNKFYYGIRLPTLKLSNDKSKIGKSFKISDTNYLNFEMKRFLVKNEVKIGDQVVFAFPVDTSKDFVKRCVGLPGDKIEIIDKILYINDVRQIEKYVTHKDQTIYKNDTSSPLVWRLRDNFGPIILPENYFFVMGDNRDDSNDSRFWGPLHKDYIKGKPICIFFPIKRISSLKNK